MPVTFTLPDGIEYAGAAIVSSFWLVVWQTIKVGKARRQAGIKYPQLYAEAAQAASSNDVMKFNCTQRAHQNTLENLPVILASTAITATKYPILAASLCAGWVFSRVLYTIGYSTGDPGKRNLFQGAHGGGLLATLLLVSTTYTVAKAFF